MNTRRLTGASFEPEKQLGLREPPSNGGLRPLRSIGWLALAAALHGALLALAPSVRARRDERQPVAIALVDRAAPTRPPPPSPSPSPSPSLSPSPSPRRPSTSALVQRRASASPAAEPENHTPPPETGPTAPASSGPPAPVELFAPSVLGAIVGPPPPPDWGGHTRRAGDPEPPRVDDGALINRRVRGWLSDAKAEDRVRSGDVAPHWRDIERQIAARFHPTAEEASSRSTGALIGLQLLRGLTTAPAPSTGPALPSGRALERWEEQRAQSDAAYRHFTQPGDWKRVVVDVELGADGRVVAVRLAGSSGRRALDAAALEAARQAAVARGRPDRRGATVARFFVDATPQVELLSLMPLVDPASGRVAGVMPQLRFDFDEVTGKIDLQYPTRREVRTRITLSAVRPATEAE